MSGSWIASCCPRCGKLVEYFTSDLPDGTTLFHFMHCDIHLTEPGGRPKDADANSEAIFRLGDRLKELKNEH